MMNLLEDEKKREIKHGRDIKISDIQNYWW